MRCGAAAAAGSGQGPGKLRCKNLVRFRKVLVQVFGEVPELSGEDTHLGFGGFCAVPEGSGADTL